MAKVLKNIDVAGNMSDLFISERATADMKGTYGQVLRVKNKFTGRKHALKHTEFQEEGRLGVESTSLREIVIMQELKHINVMRQV